MIADFLYFSGSSNLTAHLNHCSSFLTGWTILSIQPPLQDHFLYISQNELSKIKPDNVLALFKTPEWLPNALRIKSKLSDVSYKATFNLRPVYLYHLIYFQSLFTCHSPDILNVSRSCKQVMPSLYSEILYLLYPRILTSNHPFLLIKTFLLPGRHP